MVEPTDSESRSKLDINLERVHCPECGAQMPAIRIPKGWHDLMWGGWTCPSCGCRMDKWGKALNPEKE